MKVSATIDAERGECDLDAEGDEIAPEPAIFRVEAGERDAGYRGGQGEGEIDQRVRQGFAGKVITHQHPGD